MDTKFTFITLFCSKNTCVKYKQFPYICVKYIYVVNGMQTIILTFKDVLKIHSKLIFIQYIFNIACTRSEGESVAKSCFHANTQEAQNNSPPGQQQQTSSWHFTGNGTIWVGDF